MSHFRAIYAGLLKKIPTLEFVTGGVELLKAVLQAYAVEYISME